MARAGAGARRDPGRARRGRADRAPRPGPRRPVDGALRQGPRVLPPTHGVRRPRRARSRAGRALRQPLRGAARGDRRLHRPLPRAGRDRVRPSPRRAGAGPARARHRPRDRSAGQPRARCARTSTATSSSCWSRCCATDRIEPPPNAGRAKRISRPTTAMGVNYCDFRRADPRIEAAIWAALGDARSVVNVGAGTGSYEPPDREVIAVEPSPVMIAQRPAGRGARARGRGRGAAARRQERRRGDGHPHDPPLERPRRRPGRDAPGRAQTDRAADDRRGEERRGLDPRRVLPRGDAGWRKK